MLFNSYAFLIFLPVVFVLYWQIKNLRVQNAFLLIASYVFYGWWDWRFLSLIVFSSSVDYLIGIRMAGSTDSGTRRRLLWCSLIVNLGLLGFFKYFNFFIDSAAVLLTSFGLQSNVPSLQVILPVGISFYTFQTLSYSIDIYHRKIEPTRDPVAFFSFVSFFPQLVAGPIERAKQFLPQFLQSRKFDAGEATDGMRQILWGFFKKVVIADNCALIADYCFQNHADLNWLSHGVGIVFFALQIYCDFSGYSDIAIGLARLFGFRLMRNFAYPYFSRDMAEFWRRWHISLSTWFRDYVYIPLGGSHSTKSKRIRNILVTFTVSGLWHGASWNFVLWGFLNGMYYIPLMLLKKYKVHTEIVAQSSALPSVREFLQIALTFALTCIAWVFFRAGDIPTALSYLESLAGFGDGSMSMITQNIVTLGICGVCVPVMVITEWLQRKKEHGLAKLLLPGIARWLIYLLLALSVINFWGSPRTFIYFQF